MLSSHPHPMALSRGLEEIASLFCLILVQENKKGCKFCLICEARTYFLPFLQTWQWFLHTLCRLNEWGLSSMTAAVSWQGLLKLEALLDLDIIWTFPINLLVLEFSPGVRAHTCTLCASQAEYTVVLHRCLLHKFHLPRWEVNYVPPT